MLQSKWLGWFGINGTVFLENLPICTADSTLDATAFLAVHFRAKNGIYGDRQLCWSPTSRLFTASSSTTFIGHNLETTLSWEQSFDIPGIAMSSSKPSTTTSINRANIPSYGRSNANEAGGMGFYRLKSI